MRRLRPAVVVGFGGYPTVPPMLAASRAGVPTRDPRAERRPRPRQPVPRAARRAIATVAELRRRGTDAGAKTAPRRPAIRCGPAVATRRAMPLSAPPAGWPVPPPGVRRQPGRARLSRARAGRHRRCCAERRAARLRMVQQARAGGPRSASRDAYRAIGIAAELAPFFTDLPRADRRSASGDLPLRRLDRRRARRHRPAGDPGAAARRRSTRTRRPTPRCWRRPAALVVAAGGR